MASANRTLVSGRSAAHVQHQVRFHHRQRQSFALDRETGKLQWEHNLSVVLSAPPAADDTQIYLSTVQARVWLSICLPSAFRSAPTPTPSASEEKTDEKNEKKEDAGDKEEENADKKEEKKEAKPAQRSRVAPAARRPTRRPKRYGGRRPRLLRLGLFDESARRKQGACKQERHLFGDPQRDVSGPAESRQRRHSAAIRNSIATAATARSRRRRATPTTRPISPRRTPTSTPSASTPARCCGATFPGRPVPALARCRGRQRRRRRGQDLYVTAEGKGLARLNRDTGEPLWNIRKRDFSPEADRILAVNPKFVYATDGGGRMLVLDRKNGRQLSRYDVHDFVFPVVNADNRPHLSGGQRRPDRLPARQGLRPARSITRSAPKPPAEKPLAGAHPGSQRQAGQADLRAGGAESHYV